MLDQRSASLTLERLRAARLPANEREITQLEMLRQAELNRLATTFVASNLTKDDIRRTVERIAALNAEIDALKEATLAEQARARARAESAFRSEVLGLISKTATALEAERLAIEQERAASLRSARERLERGELLLAQYRQLAEAINLVARVQLAQLATQEAAITNLQRAQERINDAVTQFGLELLEAGASFDEVVERSREFRRELLQSTEAIKEAAVAVLADFAEQADNTFEQVARGLESVLGATTDALANSLAEFLKGNADAGEAAKAVLRSFAEEVLRVTTRMLALKAIGSLIEKLGFGFDDSGSEKLLAASGGLALAAKLWAPVATELLTAATLLVAGRALTFGLAEGGVRSDAAQGGVRRRLQTTDAPRGRRDPRTAGGRCAAQGWRDPGPLRVVGRRADHVERNVASARRRRREGRSAREPLRLVSRSARRARGDPRAVNAASDRRRDRRVDRVGIQPRARR